MSRRALAVLAVLAFGLVAVPQAGAHAVATSTSPTRGAALKEQPASVVFRFSEGVETSFGAVRVFDSGGKRVDEGPVTRPSGSSVAVGLARNLPDGAFTATYRVVSSDSHPVSGGFTFTVGKAGGAPAASVAGLIDSARAGPVTETAFDAVRALGYAAIALTVGGAFFLLAVWRPSIISAAGAAESWGPASDALAARARTLLLIAASTGAVSAVLGIVLQGATAGGTDFAGALDTQVIQDVGATRFGAAWAGRLVAFLLVGIIVFASAGRAGRRPMTGWLLAIPLAYLTVAPALSGHAGAKDQLLLIPTDVVHVAAMSVWAGGLAMMVFALPAATRRLPPADRTVLLATCVARFSTLALVAVAALLASGIVQSIVHLQAFGDLIHSAFGRAVLIKVALFVGLIALGAFNRQRSRPHLAARAEAGEAPGAAGAALRRAIRAEIALLAIVLVVTGALVGYSPTAGAATSGPFAAAENLGPARLELTVDPARVGANEIHLYLFDRRSGAQYDRPRELTVTALLADKQIGPLRLPASKTGPGHYTVRGAMLAPAGDWTLAVQARVSEFDAYDAKLEVPVR